MSDSDAAIGGDGRSPRFTLWVAMWVFATITMSSNLALSRSNEESAGEQTAYVWSVTGSILVFCFATIVVLCHCIPIASVVVVGTKIEGAISFILAAFWAGLVGVVTNTSSGLGVSNDNSVNQVVNGNLYYFSWAGFFTSVIICVYYLRSSFGLDVTAASQRSARLNLWAGVLAASMIVLGSSVQIFENQTCQSDTESFCKRTKFAIAVGTLNLVGALLMVCLKLCLSSVASWVLEFTCSVLLLLINVFGVSYITSPLGPGSPIGNLYYSSWISLVCAALLVANGWEARGGASAAANNDPSSSSDNPHAGNGTSSNGISSFMISGKHEQAMEDQI